MFAVLELTMLSAWCSSRGLRWTRDAGSWTATLLDGRSGGLPWQRSVLGGGPGGLRLLDEMGAVLAEASNLPALLDAVDGGIGETAMAG